MHSTEANRVAHRYLLSQSAQPAPQHPQEKSAALGSTRWSVAARANYGSRLCRPEAPSLRRAHSGRRRDRPSSSVPRHARRPVGRLASALAPRSTFPTSRARGRSKPKDSRPELRGSSKPMTSPMHAQGSAGGRRHHGGHAQRSLGDPKGPKASTAPQSFTAKDYDEGAQRAMGISADFWLTVYLCCSSSSSRGMAATRAPTAEHCVARL